MQSIHFTNTLLFLGSLALTAWWLSDTDSTDHNSLPFVAAGPILEPGRLDGDPGNDRGGSDWIGRGAGGYAVPFSQPAGRLCLGLRSELAAAGTDALDASCRGRCRVLLCDLAGDAGCGRGWPGLWLDLLGLQFVLGIADVLLLAPTWIQIVHLLGADLYWIALVCLAAEALWGR